MKKLFFIITPFIYLLILLDQQEKAFTQDLGRHLKLGEIIVHTLSVPKVNLFSYVEPSFPFTNHHWFSEVLFYAIAHTFGINSLIILKVLGVFLSFFLVWMLSYKKAGAYWTFFFAIPYLSLFAYRFDTRPEIFSFIFISLFVFFIEQYRTTLSKKALYALPFIELLWVNIHIYFVVGIMILGIFLLSEIMRKRNIKFIIGITIITVLSTLINPNGIAGALTPATILQHYGYSIVENQNIFFLNAVLPSGSILMFEILAVVCACLLLFSPKKNIYMLLLAAMAISVSAYMVRNFPIFVLATFPYVPEAAMHIEKRFEKQTRIIISSLVLLCVGGFLLIDSFSRLSSPVAGFSYFIGAQPAVDFFESNHLKGPIFNNFDIGSYLIYRLYPQERVYVDGRPEAYSVAFFDEYKKMQEDAREFTRQDAKYHFNTIVFSHTDLTPWAQTFLASMVKNPKWTPVYLDPMIIILVRNVPQNKALIDRYKITLP